MKFKALIDGVHIDPKKGTVKISLAVASHISLDELTTIGPRDENIHVTFESEQAKIDVFPLVPTAEDAITLSEEEAVKLKEAADRLEEGFEKGDEVEGGGQGGIV